MIDGESSLNRCSCVKRYCIPTFALSPVVLLSTNLICPRGSVVCILISHCWTSGFIARALITTVWHLGDDFFRHNINTWRYWLSRGLWRPTGWPKLHLLHGSGSLRQRRRTDQKQGVLWRILQLNYVILSATLWQNHILWHNHGIEELPLTKF